MIVSPKRLRLLAISSRIEYTVCAWSRTGNFTGCNKPLAWVTTDIYRQISSYRRLHQTMVSGTLIQCPNSMLSLGAKAFSTSTFCQFKQIIDDKKLRATKIKKLHWENKELFGELLESRTKAKRSKKASTKKKVILNDDEAISSKDGDEHSLKSVSPKTRKKKTVSSSTKIGKSSKKNLKDADSNSMNRSSEGSATLGLDNKGQFPEPEPLPSINQLMASFYEENVDMTMKTGSKSKGRGRPKKVVNQDKAPEPSWTTNSKPPDDNVRLVSISNNVSPNSVDLSHDDTSTIVNEMENLTDESPSSSSSLSSSKFPFDNPDRLFFEDENSSANQKEIISIPFPRKPSSAIITSNNYESGPPVHNNRLPSVSKILSATMPEEQSKALEKWQQKMIEKMGEDGFRRYKQGILNNGMQLHSNIFSLLSGKPAHELSISKSISGHWSSLQGILSQVERVHILESHVTHPHLNYCGIVDCIAVFRDKLVVIDWKTSQKPKPYVSMTYDTPLQIAAYIGAINYDPNYSIKVTEGLIAIAYENGHNSQVFHLNPFEVSRYWKMWLDRLRLFQNQAQSPSSLPITPTTPQITP